MLTVDDLVRFQEAGVRIEAEIKAAEAKAAQYELDAKRYAVLRGPRTNRQTLKLIHALSQYEGPQFDSFVDSILNGGVV